ncbi:3684_t:CDS:2 [Entrophospora sp. SA101]|nr:3684_t:CDS:2 [Entrophospora sp. SA101]
MNKKLKIYENLYKILSDSEPKPSGESLLNINREESEINLIFSQEDNEKYNDKQEIITYICIICKNRYKPSNTPDKFAPKPYAKSEKRYQQLTNTIVDFIVCCQLPFAIVDNPYFTTMLNTFDGRYQVPCRQTIKSEIINNYNNMKKKILQELSQTKKISITCDIWSSITIKSYFGITVHFIDHNWKLQHFLLDLLYFPGSHSAVRIQQLILQALDDAKITKKLLGITMDNAQSMIAAARELKIKLENQEFVHQRCAARILNIAVQHGLQLSDPIIKKIPELKPDLDVETRWNNNEWQNIENIIQLLEPIFLATEILSSSTYPTISDVQLIFIGLLRHLESFIQNQNNLEDCVMANSINYDKCDEAISSLQNLMPLYKINNQLGNTRINTQSQENKRSYFEFLLTDQTSEERPTDDEITRYISAPIINTNPLEWWQRFEKDFPILSQIALCYLNKKESDKFEESFFLEC